MLTHRRARQHENAAAGIQVPLAITQALRNSGREAGTATLHEKVAPGSVAWLQENPG